MLRSLKELKREAEAKLSERDIERDEDGRAVLKMCIRDNSGFLSPYSIDNEETISEDTAEFIRHAALGIPPKEELTLKIYGDCLTEEDKEVYPNAISAYFSGHYTDIKGELKKNKLQSFIMFFIGVAGLAVMLIGEFLDWEPLWTELLDVFSCFFIWETVDLFFLGRAQLRRMMRRYISFINMKVEFCSETDEKIKISPNDGK